LSFPKQRDIEVPLLAVIDQLGGEAKPRDIYPLITERFPELTAEEQEERLESSPSTRKWHNLVQWVRQRLVQSGELDGSTRGVWKITEAGRKRLNTSEAAAPLLPNGPAASHGHASLEVNLRDLQNLNRNEVKARLLDELKQLTPRAFEHFCREFLGHLGYRSVEVTRQAQDGGLDGYGDFRQGAISIKSAFQAKRWTDAPVGRPEIDKFRGAIQGDFDHGVFMTTSRFTKAAKEASYKKGAITILLLDGEAIAEILIERNLGVVRQPLFLYDVDPEFFAVEDT
jgi:restriction system protein